MKPFWIQINNINEYVKGVLDNEASDIPKNLIDYGIWIQDVMSIDEINVENSLTESHKKNTITNKEKRRFYRVDY